VPMPVLEHEAGRTAAIRYVIDAYDGVPGRPGKGLPHAQAAADLVRAARHDEMVQVAAMLHDVVEDTPRTVEDVADAFGPRVASMVDALTEDPTIKHYAQRKRNLRSRAAAAGPEVLDISLADKIASLRHALLTGDTVSARKLSHYRATLQIALAAGASDMLCEQLEDLLTVVSVR
jgi:(p)ppGpp synthase/HD superfamily hydrolase